MAREATRGSRPLEPEDESQEAPEPEAQEREVPREAGGGPRAMSKVDAVRVALTEGIESPEQGTDFIRRRFGIEMGRQHFSATKSQLRNREGGVGSPKGKRAPKGGRTPASGSSPPTVGRPAAEGSMDMIDDLAAVKSLVKRLGAEQVRKIVDLFEE
jgi:hypothetical protein